MTNERARVALITGGAQGIGLAVGQRLHDEGWVVVAADLHAGEAEAAGLLFRPLDVRDREQVDATLSSVVTELGGLDLLVNNAGIQRHRPIVDLTWDDWAAVVDVNLHGVFNTLQAGGRIMLERGGGVIVNMASVAAERGAPGRAPYSTTKAAIVGLTRAAAVEWAANGVRVNAVGPGYVDTGVLRAAIENGTLAPADILERIPAGRFAAADEIAATISFLASPGAAYLTGQVIYVDGGFLADYGVNVRR